MAAWRERFTGDEIRRLAIHVNEGLMVATGVMEGLSLAQTLERVALVAGAATLFAGALSVALASYSEMRSEEEALESFLAEESRLRDLSPHEELEELTGIYVDKGLPADLARTVAEHLPAAEALAEHAVEELGYSPDFLEPHPVLASALAALAFGIGATVPIMAMLLTPDDWTPTALVVTVLVGITITSWVAARSSRMRAWPTVRRGLLFGGLALLASAVIGQLGG